MQTLYKISLDWGRKLSRAKDSGTRCGALQVYDELREDILWLRIKPGATLDEVGLAARFKVSRTPIREAFLLLLGKNFVQFLPNRTTIAAPFLLNNLGDYMDTFLILSRGAVRSTAVCGLADPVVLNSFLTDYAEAIRQQRFHDALRVWQTRLLSATLMKSDRLVTGVINTEYHIVAKALNPKVAQEVERSGHLVKLEDLK